MSAQDLTDETVTEEATEQEDERNSDLLASKLSKELNNWRRKRTTGAGGRPRHDDGLNSAFKTESARTIKVRGHETLVVRKPKLTAKPSAAPDRNGQ
jgi:hypothetical protein